MDSKQEIINTMELIMGLAFQHADYTEAFTGYGTEISMTIGNRKFFVTINSVGTGIDCPYKENEDDCSSAQDGSIYFLVTSSETTDCVTFSALVPHLLKEHDKDHSNFMDLLEITGGPLPVISRVEEKMWIPLCHYEDDVLKEDFLDKLVLYSSTHKKIDDIEYFSRTKEDLLKEVDDVLNALDEEDPVIRDGITKNLLVKKKKITEGKYENRLIVLYPDTLKDVLFTEIEGAKIVLANPHNHFACCFSLQEKINYPLESCDLHSIVCKSQ
jgi:hypothetical protein